MAYIPPPRPLTRREFKKAWDSGARTMAELDPAFAKWCRQGERLRTWTVIAIGISIFALFLALTGPIIVECLIEIGDK